MKSKRFVWGVAMLTMLSMFMVAGLKDRMSDIDLERKNYVSIPEISDPADTPPSNRGWIYVKDNAGTSDLYFEDDAGTVTELTATAGGAVSLDSAYNQSPTVTVDSTAITLNMSHATNVGLDINKTAGSGNTIDIQNAGTGADIEGSDDTWNVTKAGVGTFLSFALENGATIDNAANGTISFIEGTEDLDIAMGSNIIDFSTDTGAVTWEHYDGTASIITKTADGSADDFTFSLTGATDSSIIIASAGTAADALQLTASAGGIDIAAVGAAGQDVDISNTGGSVNLSATENAASAIYLLTNGGTSETIAMVNTQGTGDDAYNIDATAGGIDVDAALSIVITSAEDEDDAIVIDASAGGLQLLTSGSAAGEDILLTATGSSVVITATEAAADAVVIAASTAVGGIDITSNADVDITTTGAAGEDITLTNTGGSVNITATEAAADAVVIAASTAVGGIDITSNADIDITTTGAAGEDISVTNTGGSVIITATESATDSIVISSSVGGINIAAAAAAATEDITITSTGSSILATATENAADSIKLDSAGGTTSGIILLANSGTGDESILLDSDLGGITINANAGSIDIEAVGASDGDLRLIAGDDLTITGTGIVAITGEILKQNERVTAANTITAAECGKIFYLDADAEFESILPAISTVSAGCYFKFVIADAADGADYTVVSGNTLEDVIYGSVIVNSTHVACSAEDTITLDDGILEGDWVDFESDGTFWYINGSAPIAGDILCTAT